MHRSLGQIYNLILHRKTLLVAVLLLWSGLAYTQNSEEEIKKEAKKVSEKIKAGKEKGGKLKTFVLDTIPAYTDEFGDYLKEIVERQNRFDYLDQVPKAGAKENVILTKPRRYQELVEQFNKPGMSEAEWTGIEYPAFAEKRQRKNFLKEIYAFHGFWEGNSYELYDFNAISRIGYIGFQINSNNGKPIKLPNWVKSNLAKRCSQYQVALDLVCVIASRSETEAFLSNPKAWEVFADSAIQALSKNNGSGLVIDLYGVSDKTQKQYKEFIKFIKYRLGEVSNRLELSVILPSQDIQNAYSAQDISGICDRVIVFTSDYNNYSGILCSTISPLVSNRPDGLSVDKTFNDYIRRGVPTNKIILVTDLSGKQFTQKQINTRSNEGTFFGIVPFTTFEEDYCVRFRPHAEEDNLSQYISFSSGSDWFITWGENLKSLSLKADYINKKDIKGAGYYHVSGAMSKSSKFWPLVYKKFAVPETLADNNLTESFLSIPDGANIDSILSVNQALVMSAINLANNPFLPEKPETKQIEKANLQAVEYKEIGRVVAMFFTVLLISCMIALSVAMFDEKVRMVLLYEYSYYFVVPSIMLIVAITFRLTGFILNTGMEFLVGGLFGLLLNFLIQSFLKKRENAYENTP